MCKSFFFRIALLESFYVYYNVKKHFTLFYVLEIIKKDENPALEI